MAWINSLEAMIQTDTLPVNVMMLIEGEEILGSPHYADMFERYKGRLAKADCAFTGGMTQSSSGAVSVNLGYRGMLVVQLEVSGELWGKGPKGMPLHSSLKNVTHSPASRLANVLASLTDERGAEILVDGLEEPIKDPSPEDEKLIEDLLQRFGEENIKNVLGLTDTETKYDWRGRKLLMNYLYKPSLNIQGIYSGYTGPGSEVFTVPEKAVARLDLRLPAGLTCEHTLNCLRAHLEENGFSDVKIRVLADHDYSRSPADSEIVEAIVDTYRAEGLEVPIWPYKGGGGPWSLYRSELGLPLIMAAGLGGGARRDRGDEYLVIEGNDEVAGLLGAEKSHVDILHRYAQI